MLRGSVEDFEDFSVSFYESFEGVVALREGAVVATVVATTVDPVTTVATVVAQLRNLGMRVRAVEQDLVDIPEIAARLDRSRQSVHQWATGQRHRHFPAPLTMIGDKRIWRWDDVVAWLQKHIGTDLPRGLDYADECLINTRLLHSDDSTTTHRPGDVQDLQIGRLGSQTA